MRRRHAFEFCDLAALPRPVRGLTTSFLEAALRVTRSYVVAAAPLAAALRATGSSTLLDLGSGGAGPLVVVLDELERRHGLRVRALMSDRQPDLPSLAEARLRGRGRLDYVEGPVDALAVPPRLRGFRTLFDVLHHFRPEEARRVLADAVRRGEGIAAFEVTERSVTGLLRMLLLPFAVLLFMPFARPPSLLRLLLTYVVPLAPLIVTWDATVSTLRSYTCDELRELAVTADPAHLYRWEVGSARRGLQRITWIVGVPRR